MIGDRRKGQGSRVRLRSSFPHNPWRLGLALALVALTACVSQAGPSPDRARLRKALEQSLPPQPEGSAETPAQKGEGDYHMHVAGIVECGGFLRKTQTVYGEAWATRPGEDGPRVKLKKIELRIEYLGGVFEGLSRKKKAEKSEAIALSDVIRGNFASDLCGCVRFVGVGRPRVGSKIRTRLDVCPES